MDPLSRDKRIDNLIDQIEDLKESLKQLESFALTSPNIGQLIEWTSGSAIIGWTSTTEQEIYYKKSGKTVYIYFRITGTSNVNACSFTVPFTRDPSTGNPVGTCLTEDDGTDDIGYCALNTVDALIFVKDAASSSTGWTTSGTKSIYGQFRYETKE